MFNSIICCKKKKKYITHNAVQKIHPIWVAVSKLCPPPQKKKYISFINIIYLSKQKIYIVSIG